MMVRPTEMCERQTDSKKKKNGLQECIRWNANGFSFSLWFHINTSRIKIPNIALVLNGLSWDLPSTTRAFYWWTLGAAQYNRSLLLVETGRCPVPLQCSTVGHWEMPSTTAVFYWWKLGAVQYNHSLVLVDAGGCPVQPQHSTCRHLELPSTTKVYWWKLEAAQYNHSLLLVDTGVWLPLDSTDLQCAAARLWLSLDRSVSELFSLCELYVEMCWNLAQQTEEELGQTGLTDRIRRRR